jgi:hypothetical protein
MGAASMKVIYITGASHSGSTLLAMMLNAHPEIISVGELYKLNMKLKKNAETGGYPPCSCGAPSLWECGLWSRVNKRILAKTNGSLDDLGVLDYSNMDARSSANAVVLRAISEVTGKPIVVDSSKTIERLAYLLRLKELHVHPIVLLRDPKGQVSSIRRKYGGFFGPILRYERVYERLRRELRSIPHSVACYEDLVRHPEQTLQHLLKSLGLDFHPQQLKWGHDANHFVGGNRLRRQRPNNSELILDERWRRSLTRTQAAVIDLLSEASTAGRYRLLGPFSCCAPACKRLLIQIAILLDRGGQREMLRRPPSRALTHGPA